MKKKIILLGGNNNCNITWLKKMKRVFEKDYEVSLIYYENWQDNSDINFEVELLKLKELTKDMNKYIIIAKSAGGLLSLNGIAKKLISPETIIFMGVPLEFAKRKNINVDELFKDSGNSSRVVVIQQKHDPQGKSVDVAKTLSSQIKLIEINGNHHTYAKYEQLKIIIDNLIVNNQ